MGARHPGKGEPWTTGCWEFDDDEESQRAAARDPAIRCAEGMETALEYLARIEDRLRIS